MTARRRLTPQRKAIEEFLGHLPWKSNCYRPITAIDSATGRIETRYLEAPGDLNGIFEWLRDRNRAGWGIYFGINLSTVRGKTKLSEDDIEFVCAFHTEIDAECGDLFSQKHEMLYALETFELSPTMLVDSGNGCWGFWLLEEPVAVTDENKEVLRRANELLRDAFDGDKVINLDRIARLPSTINWPNEKKLKMGRKPTLAELVFFDEKLCYAIEDFHDELTSLRTLRIHDTVKKSIVEGHERFNDRSTHVCSVTMSLVRARHTDDEIWSVLTHPTWAVGARYHDTTKYKNNQRGDQQANAWIEGVLDSARKEAGIPNLGARSPEGDEKWPDPLPLPDTLPSVPEFPMQLLPVSLRRFATDVAKRINCPIEYVATNTMVLAGSVIGRQLGFRPKMNDDWTVIPNTWGMCVGAPSTKKSPALDAARRPIETLKEKARRDFSRKMNEWNALAEEEQKETPQPTMRRYTTNDSTHEKVGELLAENPNGIAIICDEMIRFLASLETKGREGARGFYNEGFNGYGAYEIDRIGRGSLCISNICVSILGNVTPGPLRALVAKVARGGVDDDGFVQRFLMGVWPDEPPYEFVDEYPDKGAQAMVARVFERLAEITDSVEGGAFRTAAFDKGIYFLRPSDPAYDLFTAKAMDLEQRARSNDESPVIRAVLGKQPRLIASTALIYHVIDSPRGGPVSEEAMRAAIGWAELLEAHARRIFSAAIDFPLFSANELLQKIKQGKLGQRFTLRELYRPGWTGLRNRDDALAAVECLEDFGYLRERKQAPRPQGGRPTQEYDINPRILELDGETE